MYSTSNSQDGCTRHVLAHMAAVTNKYTAFYEFYSELRAEGVLQSDHVMQFTFVAAEATSLATFQITQRVACSRVYFG